MSNNCPYCNGYETATGFVHERNCPTLTQRDRARSWVETEYRWAKDIIEKDAARKAEEEDSNE